MAAMVSIRLSDKMAFGKYREMMMTLMMIAMILMPL